MPSKEKNDLEKEAKVTKKVKKTSTKKDSKTVKAKSKTATKKTTTRKKATSKKSTTKKNTASKKTSTKKTSSVKKTTTKKVAKKTTSTETKKVILEHYDLPYRYNQTVVKVLAQTPTKLFAYWDMSDDTVQKFKEQYGPDFLDKTKPVLIVKNDTMNYSFEVDVDDFAHGWYIDVADANCNYSVELGRRAKYYNDEQHINIPNNYIYISSSNEMASPNDKILFDKNLSTVYFKDVKTNIVTEENIFSIPFFRRLYSLYGISESALLSAYKYLKLDLKNPSSGNPSSTFR